MLAPKVIYHDIPSICNFRTFVYLAKVIEGSGNLYWVNHLFFSIMFKIWIIIIKLSKFKNLITVMTIRIQRYSATYQLIPDRISEGVARYFVSETSFSRTFMMIFTHSMINSGQSAHFCPLLGSLPIFAQWADCPLSLDGQSAIFMMIGDLSNDVRWAVCQILSINGHTAQFWAICPLKMSCEFLDHINCLEA